MQFIQFQSQNPITLNTPSDGNFNVFIDQTDNNLKVKDSAGNVYGGGGSNGYIEITYSDLINTILTSGLTTGSFYLITDFKTCYDQPDYDYNGEAITGETTYHEGPIQPIMVLATSSNTLSVDAFQPAYPKDKIKYDYSFSATEITSNVAYGRITERIDEFNNRTDYDHRTILFKRYKTYFYELNNQLQGTISVNGTSVIGDGTNFVDDLYVGDVIYVLNYDKYFKIINIISETEMTIDGFSLINDSNLTYYYAEPYIDGPELTIPYTHTIMTDPPIDYASEASLSDFAMDGVISGGTNYFGSGSTYFTNLYPGLFTMAAYDISINTFTVNGNLGADGDGSVSFFTYSTTGGTYTAYVKKVYGAYGDPSVNQIMIINTDGSGVQYNYSMNTNSGLQKLYYINNATQIHYLVTSARNSIEITDENLQYLIEKYLTYVDSGSLSNTLSSLNINYSNITDHIGSDLFLFNDVQDGLNTGGGYIDDGGDDMYDGGNYILTDIVEAGYDYRCYEYKNNNIKDDEFYSKELKTFQYDWEIENEGFAKSINNYVGDASLFYNTNLEHSYFLLANNVFGKYSYSNSIGDRSYNNSTHNWFVRNTISNRFYHNKIYRGFYSNIIGEYCYYNNFVDYFYKNRISEDFSYNKLGQLYDNDIKNAFNSNTIFNYFYQNNIDSYFSNNLIYNNTYNNTIGINFGQNNIYSEFYDNKIGVEFQNNVIGDFGNIDNFEFYRNVIGNNFNNNYVRQNFQNNQIGNQFNNNKINGNSYKNVIGNGFNNNETGYDMYSNHIGNGFNGNKINDYFRNNNIGEYFENNRISNNFNSNKIGNFANYNRFGDLSFYSWYDLSDVVKRNYTTFRNALDNYIGSVILGKELIMHDTVNDEYHKVKFTQWTQNNNGGGFSYERQLIYPTTGPVVNFTKTNYGNQVDVIVPGVLEITRGNYGGQIYNSAVENNANNNSPANTEWNSIYSTTQNGEDAINNQINDNFSSNVIYERFGYNKIGNNFYSNQIASDFGYGGGNDFGNIIADDFYSNNIGKYCYNNRFANTFNNNTIGHNFEENIIETGIGGTNFNQYYNNITGITYVANGSTANDNTYYGVAGITNGFGLNATFDITVTSNVVSNVVINNAGNQYQVNDTVNILGSQIGGSDGSDDVIITISGVTTTPSVYEDYTCHIFKNSGNLQRLSYYDSNDILTITDINI